MGEAWQTILAALIYTLMALLCLGGVLLSALSISGTWLVVLAAVAALLVPDQPFPGWGTILVFLLVAALVEGVEALAGAWGVVRRGGSRLAGVAAIAGGLLGLVLGSAFPPPLVGGLIGMLAGSFGLVYAVERRRLRESGAAARIAWGSVVSRIGVLAVKLSVTIGMIVWLVAGLR